MGKIQFPNLRALPAGPRWLAYGVLLLCAILVGGVITAYGGMLLVVLMWAVCMGGLCLLLHFTWQTVFPGQRVAQDKTFLRSWLAGSAVGVAVIAALVCYRQTVYSDDAINYFAKQTLLFGSFGQSGFYGIHVLLESLLTADYKMFMNLFISVPYLFTGRSINAFMVCYAITCFVPMWFALLMGAKYLAQQLPACHTALYYPLCMAVMVLWPMFLWPATHGMPDAFGLTFAAVIALLCADYRFETLPWPRLLAIFAATFALILTRRWYMFWILAFYAVYVLAVLVGAVRRKMLGSTLKHMLLFGVPSAVIIVGALLPTFKTILTTDYADIYGAYYGGGFGNKQDALYEPLCAWCSTQVHGKCVRIDCSREETFVSNRVRHSIRFHIITWLHKDGSIAARKVECFSNQGAYASHGHSIVAKAMGSFPQIYPCDNFEGDAYTVYTNRPAAGAMRGYGMPQASFADDANIDECAKAVGMEPLEYRMKYIMPKGFHDGFSGNTNYYDSFRECLEKGKEYIEYDKKREEYAKDIGPVRRGIGVAAFWYNTAVYPISLETSSNRMLLNLDGTVTMQCGETEIGQGADTAYAQMTAEAVGLKSYHDVRVVSCQDTDITPTGLGAYASRQTYVAGFSIRQTATLLRQKILQYATKLTRQAVSNMDIVDGNIIRKGDGMVLMSLKDLAMTAQYNAADSEHITAESTYTIRNNAYSFGCTFADVEVDIPMCKVTLKKIINVHDCGKLINPALAEAQVHGGMSMAIGFGMSEQLLFDEKTGRPLNNNLLDYKLSTFMDHPHLEAQFIENPEPTSPFGTKALGEPPACSGAPAIRNAIYNATGVAIDTVPITPHVLYAEFSKAGLIHDSWKEEK